MTQLKITINVIKTIYELSSVILAKGLQEVCLNKERGLSLELKKYMFIGRRLNRSDDNLEFM